MFETMFDTTGKKIRNIRDLKPLIVIKNIYAI